MNELLQFWASIAGIIGLLIAILSLLRDAFDVQLKWSTSVNYIKRLLVNRVLLLLIIIVLFSFSYFTLYNENKNLKTIIEQRNSDPATGQENNSALSITQIPLNIQASTITNEIDISDFYGRLNTLNNPEGGSEYTLEYKIPDAPDNTYYGSRLVFSFIEPQNLTNYEYIEISVSFDSGSKKCTLSIQDNDTHNPSISIGGDSEYPNDVIVSKSGNVETIKIPLDTNLDPDKFNRGKVLSVYFTIETYFIRNIEGQMTVKQIRFLK